jgi:NAD(P)-dependent dehydrogenase (short-subunit alcohol dehydrogenase family)
MHPIEPCRRPQVNPPPRRVTQPGSASLALRTTAFDPHFPLMGALTGQRIVILGGTTGIGLSAARAFLAAEARLVVVGRNDDALERCQHQFGPEVEVIGADATDPSTAEQAILRCMTRHGGFDGLYHVAGGSGRAFGDGPLHELSDQAWTETLRLNLDAVAWSNRAAIRAFLAHHTPGCILNLGSVLATSPAPRHFATHAYATAKAAIVGLSRSLAAHYAPHNIRVNVLTPALVDTPMAQRAASDPGIQQYIRSKQPLDGGRIARPTDLDAAAVYFLSPASSFVTGQVLAIDGAWSLTDGQHAIP